MRLGNYEILRELSGKSFLAEDVSGRKLVLKLLPADCLLGNQLHPSIADRLRRVREIAMTDVANLRGVERDGERVFLVWDFVDGTPFGEFANDPKQTPDDVARLTQELVHTVEHFHSTGLVHGALHSRNVLVDQAGRIKLIDVSPLLFLDQARDQRAAEELCRDLNTRVHDLNPATIERSPKVRVRMRTLVAALCVVLFGTLLGVTIHRVVSRHQPVLPTPPRLQK